MLEIQNIYKTFNAGTVNEKTALNGVSLTLDDGDFVTVIGGNGAGKSTLLNAVAGVWQVDEGSVTIDGTNVTRLPEHKRAKFIGRVFQDPMMGTAATMQIEENLALAMRRGKARKADPGVPFWINGRMLLRGGAFCGIALFAASAAQQIGIGTTSTAKAGFLTALYVVLVPLLGVFFGRRPGVKLGICACISLAGLYLLCLAGHDTLTLTGGEWMLLLCSLLFAFQIMLVDHYSPRLDGVQLSFAEFFATAVLSTIFMFVFETPTFAQIQGAAVSIAYCGILSSGVAYTLQILGQKDLNPAIASLIMCLESVFSAIGGWLILHQSLSAREGIGCALIFTAVVLAQLPLGKRAESAA